MTTIEMLTGFSAPTVDFELTGIGAFCQPKLFCFGDTQDADRVRLGKIDPRLLAPEESYGLLGTGDRLLSLGAWDDGSVPSVARDGFRWCGLTDGLTSMPMEQLVVPGHNWRWGGEPFVFGITLAQQEGVYVADHAPYDKVCRQLRAGSGGVSFRNQRLVAAKMSEADRARALTLIPLQEYCGGYEQPVVLIQRPLQFDEVELIGGPWPDCRYVGIVAGRSLETRLLLEQALSEREAYYESPLEHSGQSRRAFELTVSTIIDTFVGDTELAEAAATAGVYRWGAPTVDAAFVAAVVQAAAEMRQLGLF